MKYGNFQDPIGLVGRMLKSGNPAAYSALLREFLGIVSRPIDNLLENRESHILSQYGDIRSPLPLIFVVGPPRGGTTLVYQSLASALPVSYFSNFSSLFPQSPIASSQLFSQFLSGRNESFDFKNYYGNTRRLSDPNDGFHVWDRWFGTNRYSPNRDLSVVDQQDMNQFFHAWLMTFDRPFLNKNNRNLYCMELLSRYLDNVYFVVVCRDPVFIAQSLFIARQKIQGDQETSWGLGSDQLSFYQGQDAALRSVAEQVSLIYESLEQQRRCIDPARIIDVQYEDFCQNPNRIIAQVYDQVWMDSKDVNIQHPTLKPFAVSNQVRLSDRSFDRLKAYVNEYSKQSLNLI